MAGWWLSHPCETYEFVNPKDDSQLNGKLKDVPNHQPDGIVCIFVDITMPETTHDWEWFTPTIYGD